LVIPSLKSKAPQNERSKLQRDREDKWFLQVAGKGKGKRTNQRGERVKRQEIHYDPYNLKAEGGLFHELLAKEKRS